MDYGDQYFKFLFFHPKIPIVPCVRFLWIDEKLCPLNITMVVVN
jgi:hypothetical protein